MTENELSYFFPYKVDKKFNFRHFARNQNDFIRQFIPNYDGTNVHDFIENKSSLNEQQKYDLLYLYEDFRNWVWWYQNGKNIFSFSKDLLTILEKTDVSEITPDFFHLPYDIFYVSLKPLNLKISKYSDEVIEGVYIDHNYWNPSGEHPEGYCDLSFRFVGDFKEIFLNFIPNVNSRLSINTKKEEVQFIESPLGNFWTVWFWFEKEEGRENVKQAVDYFLEGLREEVFPKDNNTKVTDYELDFYNSTVELLTNTINLVINCMLYLSQPQEKTDIEEKYPTNLPHNFDKKLKFAKTVKEQKKLDGKIEQLGFTKIKYVGQSFKHNNQYLFDDTNHNTQPHWRRGHWRNQKYGEKLTLKKAIWIMPTIVNKEKGQPKKGHVYDINEKTTNP
ncbi:MAG: hypothetical protein COA32_01545 [Fluviicola sp.]|nr:MAG: hypothetical protein COA32_01545 [Fluviicola sp.]